MELTFNWYERFDNTRAQKAVEGIQEFADSGHWHYRQCHRGPVRIGLTTVGVFLDQIVGRVTCQCGIVIGSLSGRADGSHLEFRKG